MYNVDTTPRQRGYTLVALVIGMAILTILTAAVAPAISVIMKRDREDELIFRGKQYARGIALFQRRYGRLPTSLKEMYENRPRTLRKLWKDPMCGCDDWFLIIQGTPEATQSGAAGNTGPQGATAPRLTPTPQPFGSPAEMKGPIIGVRSKVKKESLQQWRGQSSYEQWRFIAGDADNNIIPTFDPGSLFGPRTPTPPH